MGAGPTGSQRWADTGRKDGIAVRSSAAAKEAALVTATDCLIQGGCRGCQRFPGGQAGEGGGAGPGGREAAGHKTMQIFAAAPQRCKVGPWGAGLD